MPDVFAPIDGDDWLGLTADQLPIGDLYDWCVRPDCGAVVLFSGTVRDHAEGRTGVEWLEYEAYDEQVDVLSTEIVPDMNHYTIVFDPGAAAKVAAAVTGAGA